ncbi:hypothetical protein [Neobacillus cucumis]|nr:hypothetical protein [Neobacillus cucumis]MBM7651311.1 hypothetical protein [Neobacillus cucumis]
MKTERAGGTDRTVIGGTLCIWIWAKCRKAKKPIRHKTLHHRRLLT